MLYAWVSRQRAKLERNLDQHTAIKAADARRKQRPMFESRMHLHLVDMLVLEPECVGAKDLTRIGRTCGVLEFRDHGFSAAGISGNRVGHHRPIRWNDTRPHQRPDNG